jgi:hypothetical protein
MSIATTEFRTDLSTSQLPRATKRVRGGLLEIFIRRSRLPSVRRRSAINDRGERYVDLGRGDPVR